VEEAPLVIPRNNMKDWRVWWQLLRRRWYILFLCIFVAGAAGLYVALTSPSVYESEATIMILNTDLLSGASLRFVPGNPNREEVQYLNRLVKSNDFILKLADSLDVQANPFLQQRINSFASEHPDFEISDIANQVYIEYLKKQFDTRIKAYNMLQITGKGSTADDAYHFTRTVTNLAIREVQNSEMQSISEISTFSNQLLQIYKSRYEVALSHLERFKNDGYTSAFAKENNLDEAKLQEIESIIVSSNIDLQAKQEEVQEIKRSLNSISDNYQSMLNNSLAPIQQKIKQRIENVCQLFKKFSWKDMEIIYMNEQIGKLKIEMFDQIKRIVQEENPLLPQEKLEKLVLMENLQQEAIIIQQFIDSFKEIIREHENYLNNQPSRESERARLEKDVAMNREIYDQLMQQVRGAQIRETAQLKEAKMRFRLVVPPQKPLERVAPNRKKIMILALFCGGAIAFGIVFGLEALDVSFRSVEEVEKDLNIPVIATIPRLSTLNSTAHKRAHRRKAAIVVPIVLIAVIIVASKMFRY
jgi:uncharacterized protein involved in exopolysaccharide biosynthesis